jgi:hypothetical protein
MEYHGKLYGKIGNKHFDTGKTAKDVDNLIEMLQHLVSALKIVNSMGATKSIIERAEQLIKKST